MKIWIDGQCLQTASRLRGIGRYVEELIRSLAALNPAVEISISFNAALRDEALAAREVVERWIDPTRVFVWHGVADGGEAVTGYNSTRRLSEIALVHHVACLNPDIAISASPFEGSGDAAVPLPPSSLLDIPVASIFYDAIPYRFASEYLTTDHIRSYYFRRLDYYKSFDLNLCISEYARAEAVAISGNPLCVNVSAGISARFLEIQQRVDRSKQKCVPFSGFVLYVGALDWRKNLTSVVKAFSELPKDLRRTTKFVLAGDHPEQLMAPLRERWVSLELPAENFVDVGHVSEAELVRLYTQASLVIQPSLSEGFGLTALEAMSCGAPVIASAEGALPEVVGDDVLLFDPRNPTEIADRIAQMLTNHELAARLVAAGLERAKQFSWERTADRAVQALNKVRLASVHSSRERDNLRLEVLKELNQIDVSQELIVETMARSEPWDVSPKRLLVDATSTVRIDHRTGIQRVTKEMTRYLQQEDSANTAIIYCDDSEGFSKVLCDAQGSLGEVDRTEGGKIRFLSGDTVLMLDSSWEFAKHHMPLLLAARLKGANVVSCLYDTVPLRFEAMCNPVVPKVFVDWFEAALGYSNSFVCISRAVADELYSLLHGINFPRELKIGVMHLGADFSVPSAKTREPRAAGREAGLSFLMVGTIEIRKGYPLALDAFEALWREGADVRLLIVGRPGWGVEHVVARLQAHDELGHRLHWHYDASDEKLAELYGEADALIAASYTEGFGLPLVEAQYFGKSIIASDIPVFREVTNQTRLARFFQVGSANSLAATIRSFISEDSSGQGSVLEQSWISWRESASNLRRVILDDDWYCVYKPDEQALYGSVSKIGKTVMTEPLTGADCKNTLEPIDGPTLCDQGQRIRYIVRVTNQSHKTWSSVGASGDRYGVFLGCRVLTAENRMLQFNPVRSEISFVLVPGDSHYIAVKVPLDAKERGGAFVEIELFQEGVMWWGNALRVPIC